MVVAKADQRGHRKAQHLVRRAGPDATHHGQQVVLPEGGAEAVLIQKDFDGAAQAGFVAFPGDACGQTIEAQDLGQHLQKTGAQQIAALSEDSSQRAAAPLEAGTSVGLRHLHRERHLGGRRRHLQLFEQLRQKRIGAVVEDQKARVHALAHAIQRHIDGVGMAAEMVARLQQGHAMPPARRPAAGQRPDPQPQTL
jgi:hypothetical protein